MAANKILLAINAGSSSVKTSVYLVEQAQVPKLVASVSVSGIASQSPKLAIGYGAGSDRGGAATPREASVDSHDASAKLILKTLLQDDKVREVQSPGDVSVVCHRVVHGGTLSSGKRVTQDTYHELEAISDLAPLHNGPALSIIQSCMRTLPSADNFAFFDTHFHKTMPQHVYTYPIRQDAVTSKGKLGLRKYGFHGISYAFVSQASAEFLAKDCSSLNLIALHIGSGVSACAVRRGQSWDTSMGLTPLDGLPGATRSGSVDPSLILHYNGNASKDTDADAVADVDTLRLSTAEEILNKQSGWKALTGTDDFAAISDPESADPKHQLAFDLLCNRICGYIGSYYVALEGDVDALVFAGAIGQGSARLRSAVVSGVACLGFAIDHLGNTKENKRRDVVENIASVGSEHAVLVCQTDEQLQMAREYCSSSF